MKPQGNQQYFTLGEVAARLRVSPSTVRWLIRTRQLTARHIGEEFLIGEADLAAFIEAHTVSARPEWEAGGRNER